MHSKTRNQTQTHRTIHRESVILKIIMKLFDQENLKFLVENKIGANEATGKADAIISKK
jgi:hypothetical protein